MTGRQRDSDDSAARSATIRTPTDDAATLAASVRPDNTPEIDTRVEGVDDGDDAGDGTGDGGSGTGDDGSGTDDDGGSGTVVTTVERETTGGLRTTVDDYVVNLAVAREVVQSARRHADPDNADQIQS